MSDGRKTEVILLDDRRLEIITQAFAAFLSSWNRYMCFIIFIWRHVLFCFAVEVLRGRAARLGCVTLQPSRERVFRTRLQRWNVSCVEAPTSPQLTVVCCCLDVLYALALWLFVFTGQCTQFQYNVFLTLINIEPHCKQTLGIVSQKKSWEWKGMG